MFALAIAVTCLGLRAVASTPYSFLTIGDWGGEALRGYHATDEVDVAKQMGKTATERDIKFVVNVGDNFYYCGIQNTSDAQIHLDYTGIFTADGLQVPWYSTLGNHEYGYNVDAQVDFSNVDPTKRWVMPARYYTKRISLPNGNYLSLIVTDTSPCIAKYRSSNPSGWDPCGSDFPTCSPVDEGPCRFNANILSQDCATQHSWLNQQVSQVPKDDWLIVVGHHPAEEIDVEDFAGVFMDRFDLYLCGHVHTLQQYSVNGNNAFVISGAGAMVKTADQESDDRCNVNGVEGMVGQAHTSSSLWNQKIAGFTVHTFDQTFSTLTTEFISYTGEVLHSFSVKKGTPPGPTPRPRPSPPAPQPGACGGAGAYPCAAGCTYIKKADEASCGVSKFGCYACSSLPASCPDCSGEADVTVV